MSLRTIVWGMLVVVTAAGCMQNSIRPPEGPATADVHIAKPPPPVTPDQVTVANAPATVQALQEELNRAAESSDPPPARK